MTDPTEMFAAYCWRWQRWNGPLHTLDGQPLVVFSPGVPNPDEGPDFLDADLQIGAVRWHGHIEIDLKEHFWQQHKHHENPHYRSVVLHAVWTPDGRGGHRLPIFDISAHVDRRVATRWQHLQKTPQVPACAELIGAAHRPVTASLVEEAGMQRMQEKAEAILREAQAVQHDWETIAYILFIRYAGSGPNIDAFEATARRLPLSILLKHRQSLIQLEALLMGVAGLLTGAPADDEYGGRLQQEWRFLQHKYGLESGAAAAWKMARLRPANFPLVRMAQLAAHLHRHGGFLRPLLAVRRPADVTALTDWDVSPYWQAHYHWGRRRKGRPPRLGRQWQHNLLINVIAPLQYAYGIHQQQAGMQQQALSLWDALPAEDHRTTRPYRSAGFPLRTALHSQGAIHLYRHACRPRRCLTCPLGQAVLGFKGRTDTEA